MTATGFGWRSLLAFEIDADSNGINQTNAIIYKYLFKKEELQSHGFRFSPSDFETFSPENLSRYSSVPQATIDHFKSAKENSETPLMFLWVPHVLYRGKINVEKLKILAWWENATLKDLFADMIEHYLASKPHLDRFFEERKINLQKKQSASKEP